MGFTKTSLKKHTFWPFRLIALVYFNYKMIYLGFFRGTIFTDIDRQNAGEIAGAIVAAVGFVVIFSLYYAYQVQQIFADLQNHTRKSNQLRLFSIIFSIIFFALAGASLFNLPAGDNFGSYLFGFYTIFTIIAVISSVIITRKDITLYRTYRSRAIKESS